MKKALFQFIKKLLSRGGAKNARVNKDLQDSRATSEQIFMHPSPMSPQEDERKVNELLLTMREYSAQAIAAIFSRAERRAARKPSTPPPPARLILGNPEVLDTLARRNAPTDKPSDDAEPGAAADGPTAEPGT